MCENLPIRHPAAEATNWPRSTCASKSRPFTVIFQGSLEERRGIAELIEAARSGEFVAIIQGSGPLKAWVDSQRGPTVRVVPPCPNQEVVEHVSRACAAFVYYEDDCLNSRFACSNKFYNAVFAGAPVICNRLAAFEAFAEKHGGVVFIDRLSPDAIRAATRALAEDPVLAARLSDEMVRARGALLRADGWQTLPEAIERATERQRAR